MCKTKDICSTLLDVPIAATFVSATVFPIFLYETEDVRCCISFATKGTVHLT